MDKGISNDQEAKKTTIPQRIRLKLFRLFYELLKSRNTTTPLAAFLIALSFLQVIGFFYYSYNNLLSGDDSMYAPNYFFEVIRFYPWIESYKMKDVYLAIYFVLLSLLVIVACGIAFILYSINIGKFYFQFPLEFMKMLAILFYWVLMIPIIEFFLSTFKCSNGTHIILGTACWSGTHLAYACISGFALLLYISIFILISLFNNDANSCSVDSFSRLDSNLELYYSIFRIGGIVINHFVLSISNISIYFIGIYTLCGLFFIRKYFIELPYYNDVISTVFGVGVASFEWASIVILLAKIFEYTTIVLKGTIIFVLVGMAMLTVFVYKLRTHLIMHYILNYKYNKIRSPFTLEVYLTKLKKLVLDPQRHFQDDLVLLGFIVHHKNECFNPACPVISCDDLYHPQTNTISKFEERSFSDKILLIHLVSSIYNFYSKTSKNPELFISSSCFNLYIFGHIYKSSMDLISAEMLDVSLQQRFSIYRIKMIIEAKIKHKYQNMKKNGNTLLDKADFSNVLELEALYSKLQVSIEKSSVAHQQFWMNLKTPQTADLNIVFKQGMQIIDFSKEVYDCWEKITKINATYSKALTLYGNYLSKIKNDQEEGGKYLEQAEQLFTDESFAEHDNYEQALYADTTAVLIISAKKEERGKIIKASTGILKLIGYNSKEIMGHEINLLMPSLISDKHNQFLEDFARIGRERIIHKEQITYASNKDGEVIAIVLGIKLLTTLENGIQYIGMLKPTMKSFSFMIVSMDGVINAIDNFISQKLNLGTTIFKENQVGLQVISPQIAELYTNEKNLNSLVGPYTISFKVPKSILKYVSGGNLSEQYSKLADEWNEIEQSLSIFFEIEDVAYGHNGCLKFKILKTEKDKKEGDDESTSNKKNGLAILDDPEMFKNKEENDKDSKDQSIKKSIHRKIDMQKEETLDPTLQNLIETQKHKKAYKADQDNASIEDNTKSLNNQLRSIRNAVFEKMLPGTIRYVNIGSKLLMLTILFIAVGEFIIAYQLNSNMSIYMDLIKSSTVRNKRILGLHGSTLSLYMMSNKIGGYFLINSTSRPAIYNLMGYENYTSLPYYNWSLYNIVTFSNEIHNSQNYIASQTKLLTQDSINMIICNNVTLSYITATSNYSSMSIDCWNAFLAIIVHSYKLRSYTASQIIPSDPSVGFVLKNTLNGIYMNLLNSSSGVIYNMVNSSQSNVMNMLIILLVLSCLLLVSFVVLMPVTIKIQKEKAQVINFFSTILTSDIKQQIKKCNEFFSYFKEDKEESEKALDDEEENKNKDSEEPKKEQRTKRKSFKIKQIKSNYLIVALKFLVFICVYESFFILLYMLTKYYTQVNAIRLDELSVIKERVFINEFLTRAVVDYITSNGTNNISNTNSSNFLKDYFINLPKNQQIFLQTNIINENLHSSNYHDYFLSIVHNDTCNCLYNTSTSSTNYTLCSNFMGGLMTKGLQVANTQYWDLLGNLVNDYNNLLPAQRTYQLISQIMAEDRIVKTEMLYYRYLNEAYDILGNTLTSYIRDEVSQQNRIILIIFILYTIFLIFMYLIVWRIFMDSMRKSYHLTKSMLAIIPAEVIDKSPKILAFVKRSSREALIV